MRLAEPRWRHTGPALSAWSGPAVSRSAGCRRPASFSATGLVRPPSLMWSRSCSLTACGRSNRGMVTSSRAGQAGVGGADWLQKARDHLRQADPVLARLIADRPDFDPRQWMTELPPMDLFGALLFQIAGQQLSVAATRRILERIEARFGGRLPSAAEALVQPRGSP